MAKNQAKPQYKENSKKRREMALKRAEMEAERERKRKRNKKITIIVAIILASFLLIFSTAWIISCAVTTYEPITISDLYSGSGNNKRVSDKIISLDGKNVSIKGYMCEASDLGNKIIYISSKPGSTCPYCYETYGEAMPIRYQNPLRTIKFTSRRVLVKGRLDVSNAVEDDGMNTFFRIMIDSIEEL